ncbi:hypothetical protein IE077_001206 [Cardiosporidium cionae]|uniref:Uncharacterized protein n=1 Tax=Cardiosporidium cionae TaxID=476202 RepID=A0ABQ7J5S9_9APIC|nr:hypothetical protein IE077_001206 [Cardiosporidium cionae]|eukprot:KAF8819303.1 hypothetical protein IE077_001206 [Cardiosporidium cionae]
MAAVDLFSSEQSPSRTTISPTTTQEVSQCRTEAISTNAPEQSDIAHTGENNNPEGKPMSAQRTSTLVILMDEEEETHIEEDNRVGLPIFVLILNFIIPIAGCLYFFSNLNSPKKTVRHKWVFRAMYTSCAISAIYALVISSLLSEFVFRV